jgi:short subunit dehydrogenase-like uncharacterized protein
VNHPREFDIILFGATAFTGKLAAEYVSSHFPTATRWAIAGRNEERLKVLHSQLTDRPNPPQRWIVLNHDHKNHVFETIQKTKIAMTFAGPYGRYGENLIEACCQFGTDYLDITGETRWAELMIRKYQEEAKKSGAIVIPFSGFDSVPSDLAVWHLTQTCQKKAPKKPLSKIISVFSGKGGINGGTFQTLLDEMTEIAAEKEALNRLADSSLLVPEEFKSQFRFQDQHWPVYLQHRKRAYPPFFMALVNSRIVYRSQALRMKGAGQNPTQQTPVEYIELQNVPKPLSQLTSTGIVLAGKLVLKMGRYSRGRQILQRIGPKPGQGPSQKVQESGFFRAQFFALHSDEVVHQLNLSFPGDPGNRATVTFICEAARCLLLDRDRLEQKTGGFWTPSTAMGNALKDRLKQAGLQWTEVSSSDDHPSS